MLDWACCKNLCIPGYTNAIFDDFNKLYYNHNANRLEICLGGGIIMAGPTFTQVGTANLLDQQEGNVLMTLAAEGLLPNEAQIPAEAALLGQLQTPVAVGTGTLNAIATDLTHADPDAIMTEV